MTPELNFLKHSFITLTPMKQYAWCKSVESAVKNLDSHPDLTLTSCVILEKLLNL